MATKPQLEAEGRRLAAEIKRISEDTVMSGAEKADALDKIQPDFKAHQEAVVNSERASEMAAKLDGFAEMAPGDYAVDEKGMPLGYEVPHPFSKVARKALANKLVRSKGAQKLFALDGKAPEGFDAAMEVNVKDATAGGNLMGDFLAGGSGPSAVGQNVFGGTGTFAPGIQPVWLPGIVENLFYKLTLADLISSRSVDSPTISYMTESTYNPQAAQTAEGALYPFSSVSFARVYEQVGKITNAMTLTDEAIADAPALFNFAQGRLLENLQREEEVQILAGAGASVNGVNGLLNRAANFTVSSSSSLFGATSATGSSIAFPTSGTNGAGALALTISSLAYGRQVLGVDSSHYPVASLIAENLFDAFIDIELAVFQTPNAIIMNPRDWETVRLAKDGQGQYMGGGFFGGNYSAQGVNVGQNLWGCPVITTPLMPVHTVLTGYFDSTTIQTARRSGVVFQMTNSNGTDFVNGKITMRAEERLGLLVYRPAAFQLIQLNHA